MSESKSPGRFKTIGKGYAPEEVDAYLGQLSLRITELDQELQAAKAERPAWMPPADPSGYDAELHDPEGAVERTLAIAQQTADRLLFEARAEADRLVAEATESAEVKVNRATADSEERVAKAEAHSERIRREAVSEARRVVEQTRKPVADEIRVLRSTRDDLRGEVKALEAYLDEHRTRLREVAANITAIADDPTALRLAPQPETVDITVDLDKQYPIEKLAAEQEAAVTSAPSGASKSTPTPSSSTADKAETKVIDTAASKASTVEASTAKESTAKASTAKAGKAKASTVAADKAETKVIDSSAAKAAVRDAKADKDSVGSKVTTPAPLSPPDASKRIVTKEELDEGGSADLTSEVPAIAVDRPPLAPPAPNAADIDLRGSASTPPAPSAPTAPGAPTADETLRMRKQPAADGGRVITGAFATRLDEEAESPEFEPVQPEPPESDPAEQGDFFLDEVRRAAHADDPLGDAPVQDEEALTSFFGEKESNPKGRFRRRRP